MVLMSDECQDCGLPDAICICIYIDDEDDNAPECHDCGHDLDPNGFCTYNFCPSREED